MTPMHSTFSPSPRTAVSTVFAVLGFVSAGWIARIPAVTEKLNLDTAQLGLILLFIAIGSLSAFQFIGRLIERFGSAKTTFWFSLAFGLSILVMAFAPNPWVLAAGLFIYGFVFGAGDVAMNAQGVTVERALGKPIMGSLHGFFSLGALGGAGVSALLASLDVGLESNLALISVVAAGLVMWAQGGYIADEPPTPETKEGGSRFSLPPRALWPLGIMAFSAAVGEGAMADWGALYIHDQLGSSEGMAAIGFAAFSTTMLLGRFACDRLVVSFGAPRVVATGAIISAIGLLGGLLPGTTSAAVIGFAVMGIGLAPGFPVIYSAAGSMPGIPSGRGVAAVATIGYTGFLAGPPLLGLLARVSSIRLVFVVVALLILSIPFLTPTLRRPAVRSTFEPAQSVEAVRDQEPT
jgi:MFS family permease